jgi:hypothetical protein
VNQTFGNQDDLRKILMSLLQDTAFGQGLIERLSALQNRRGQANAPFAPFTGNVPGGGFVGGVGGTGGPSSEPNNGGPL